ncbi:GNAT family N-acetyltransferase [Jatrophihabitans sp.]|uniref:GNAT family N-acetyltransferase n=1 Tax=Jatrophihabitans sp. TaxID=1932789 RepID=UPI002C148252|nr:N-acetyltransferase [Jatrophihabitans sp.]
MSPTVPATIEPERAADAAAVRAVVSAAFVDHPVVADLVELIRASPEYLPELALVARVSGAVVGFMMLSHAGLMSDSGERHQILTLSPLAVDPAFQRSGIGSALARAGLEAAERLGEPLVVLEGSPRYYPRFGFVDCRELGISIPLPDWAPPEAGMAYPLPGYHPRLRGRVVYPPAFIETGTGHS